MNIHQNIKDDIALLSGKPALTLEEVKRRYAPPLTLGCPEDVRLAMDSQLESDGCYSLLQHTLSMGQFVNVSAFMGYAALQDIAQNGVVRACIETVANDMVRNWIEFKSTEQNDIKNKDKDKNGEDEPEDAPEDEQAEDFDSPDNEQAKKADIDADNGKDNTGKDTVDDIAALEEEADRLGIKRTIQDALSMVGYYGGCLLYLDTGATGDDLRLPLNLDPKFSAEAKERKFLKGIRLIDPINIFPGRYNSSDPLAADYYVPRTWWVLGREVHASRLIKLVDNEPPLLFKPAYNFFGIPKAQLLWDYILHFQSNRDSVNRMLGKFSLTVFKTSMNDLLTGGATSMDTMDARMQLLAHNRSNDGVFAIDKDAEDVVNITTQMSGMTDVVRQSLEILAAMNRTPAVKLLGISPSGFNATGESDIRNYYDHILSQQERVLRPALEDIFSVMQISLFGKIDRSIRFDFAPLSENDENSKAMTEQTKINNICSLLDRDVISVDEARQVLVADPDSGLNNLDPDDIPEPQGGEQEGMEGADGMGGSMGAMGGMPDMPEAPAMPQQAPQQAQDASKWITVHPGGKGMKADGSGEKGGVHALIDEETGRILGGMGGKHYGEKINEVRHDFTGPKTPSERHLFQTRNQQSEAARAEAESRANKAEAENKSLKEQLEQMKAELERFRNGGSNGRGQENIGNEQGRTGNGGSAGNANEQTSTASLSSGTLSGRGSGAGAVGQSVKVALPNGKNIDTHYEIVEAGSVQASHDPLDSFVKNTKYGLTNERQYHTEAASQASVLENAAKLNPQLVAFPSPDANQGAPVVDHEGNVLGGNSRTMSIKVAYERFPQKSEEYKNALVQNAAMFGIDPEQIKGMKHPVLIRKADAQMSKEQRQELISDLNGDFKKAMTAKTEGVSRGLKFKKDTIHQFARAMESTDATSLRDFFDKPASKNVIEKFVEDGVLQSTDLNKYVGQNGLLNPEGKKYVESALRGHFIPSYDVVNKLPAHVVEKLDVALPKLLEVSQKEKWNITPHVKGALELTADFLTSKEEHPKDFLTQIPFGGKAKVDSYSPEAVRLFINMMKDDKKVFLGRIGKYASNSRMGPETGAMPGMVKMPKASFKEAFGVGLDSSLWSSFKNWIKQ